ncbi:MAG: tetratricopeptide repeat protein [Candidatus Velthaea sp.]
MIPTRALREARLAVVEALLAAGVDPIAPAFERAQLLDQLGRTEAARAAYLAVLTRDPGHAGALNALGQLLDRTGFHTAARTVYERVVALHPDDPAGHGNLGTVLLDAGEIEAARRHYEIVLTLDPANVVAHQCLAILLLRLGDERAAAAHGEIGFRAGASTWPFRGAGEPIDVLVVHSARGGNVPIDRFIDDQTFAKSTIVAEFFTAALPPHAFVINAIGDASRCRDALRAAACFLRATSAPVVNAPATVAATAREATASALAGVPGVVASRTVTFSRAQLRDPRAAETLAAAGFEWPVIVRAPGFQTGLHCNLVERPSELAAAVAELPGEDALVIAFADVRSPSDANVRKYRVMIVDGVIFPLHLAIAKHWMVHYFRADTGEQPAYRAEEAAFLADLSGALGTAAMTALHAIAGRLALDYGGIDFALDARGRVVVFEANATMIVPPAAAEREPYRRAAVERIEQAVRGMLLARAGRS